MSSSMNDNGSSSKRVVAAGDVNASGVENDRSCDRFINGIQNESDLDAFLELVETTEPSIQYLDCLLNTTNQGVLASKELSKTIGKKLAEFIDRMIDAWNPEALTKVLKVLEHIPYDFDTMVSCALGHSLKKIRKAAKDKEDNTVYIPVHNLISKWKKINAASEQQNKRPFKLAIQKEPPVRAKAMNDVGFFNNSRLAESRKPRARPTYFIEDAEPTATNVNGVNKDDAIMSEAPARPKKRVRFAENLVHVRVFETDPAEWGDFDNGQHFGSAGEMEHGEARLAYYTVPQGPWYYPFSVELNIGEDLTIRHQIQTQETIAQDTREKTSLSAIYTSVQHIPPSPAEPDEYPDANQDTPLIPLDDISSSQEELPPPPPPPVSSQPMQQPQQIQQLQQPPPQQQPIMLPQSYIQPLPVINQPVQAPAPAPPAPPKKITGEAIEDLIRNNPELLRALNNLANLAGSTNNTLVPQQQYQPQQQQPFQPSYGPAAAANSPQYNYQHRRPNQQHQRGQQRPNGAQCKFYASTEGCRKGAKCKFSHY